MYPAHFLSLYRPFYTHEQSLVLFCFLNLHKWQHSTHAIMLAGIPTKTYIPESYPREHIYRPLVIYSIICKNCTGAEVNKLQPTGQIQTHCLILYCLQA